MHPSSGVRGQSAEAPPRMCEPQSSWQVLTYLWLIPRLRRRHNNTSRLSPAVRANQPHKHQPLAVMTGCGFVRQDVKYHLTHLASEVSDGFFPPLFKSRVLIKAPRRRSSAHQCPCTPILIQSEIQIIKSAYFILQMILQQRDFINIISP